MCWLAAGAGRGALPVRRCELPWERWGPDCRPHPPAFPWRHRFCRRVSRAESGGMEGVSLPGAFSGLEKEFTRLRQAQRKAVEALQTAKQVPQHS